MIRTRGLKSEYTSVTKISENVFYIRWNYQPETNKVHQINELTGEEEIIKQESDYATWIIEIFHYKPTLNQLKNLILDWYNKEIDRKILQGFTWNDMKIWLSTENQFNYKAAYDLAVQTNGSNLPIIFKFGTTDNPIYYTFETLEDLTNFYTSAMSYINTTLVEGWKEKDNIDWESYKIE